MGNIKLTDEDIEVNVNDEYYFREGNVCVLVKHEGNTGEEIKKQILKNQEIVERLKKINTLVNEIENFINDLEANNMTTSPADTKEIILYRKISLGLVDELNKILQKYKI